MQEAAALRCELAAARSAWAAERASLSAQLRLLGEQHDAAAGGGAAAGSGAVAAAGSGAAAAPRGRAAVAGGRAEAAGAQAASLTPSQKTRRRWRRCARLCSRRRRAGCRGAGAVDHEDELRGSEESACASTPTEPKCIKWHIPGISGLEH